MTNDNHELTEETGAGELPEHWKQIQTAVWLIGLAILAWQGWWWPGILVLVAISGLIQAGIRLYVKRGQEEQSLQQVREASLPKSCPSCGGPLTSSTVTWTSDTAAECPYCHSSVNAVPDS